MVTCGSRACTVTTADVAPGMQIFDPLNLAKMGLMSEKLKINLKKVKK